MAGETFGKAMLRLRTERGLSLRKLSAKAHLDSGHLCKIENGKRPSTIDVAKAVGEALGAVDELVAIANAERAQRVRTAVPFDPMRRRTLLTWGMAATTLASLGVSEGTAPRIGRVGASDAQRLQDSAVRLYGLDYQHGGESLWQAASVRAADGYQMLEHGTYREAVSGQLLRATGRMQMCAGWLAFDAGHHDIARSAYNEALSLARQAGDAEVETHALANLAFQSNVLGRPREALRFAEAAERVAAAPVRPARLPAIPQLRKAIASALASDRSVSDKAITQARTVLDKEADKPTEEWCAFLSPAELDGVEATCAIHLGRAPRAADLLERAIREYGDRYARNRALYRTRLAMARLEMGAVDGAAEAANAALDDLTGEVASWRVSSELHAVALRLGEYPTVPGVALFLARYRAYRKT